MQVYYLLRYYLKAARHRDEEGNATSAGISILMSVRNEEQRIKEILEKFEAQQFQDYQILVINVHSEDNTDGILGALAENNHKLKVTSLSQETQFSEKQIINIGLKGSSNPWIILVTSASGEINPVWLENMSKLLDPTTDLVVGYTNIERMKGFRSLIIRLKLS